MPQSPRRSRFRRAERTKQTYTTESDRVLIERMHAMRFATTSSLLVSLAPHRHPGGVTRRLRDLFDAQLIDRINRDGMASFGGTKEPIYFLGTGAAVEVDETRASYSRLTPEEREEKVKTVIRPSFTDHRDWRAAILEDALGLDAKEVATLLDKNESVALKIVTDMGQSNIKHFLFLSSLMSLVYLTYPEVIVDVRTDGAVKYRVPYTPALTHYKQHAVGSGADSYFPIEPDAVFVIERDGKRHAIFLEAETGTQAGNKLQPKLANYLAASETDSFDAILSTAGIQPVSSVRVAVISRTAQHFNLALNSLLDVKASGSGLFLFGHVGKNGIEFLPGTIPAESIKQNWRMDELATWKDDGTSPKSSRKNGDEDVRILATMRSQLLSALFTVLRDVPDDGDAGDYAQKVPLL